MEEQDSSYLTITWQGGKNSTGTVQLPCHSVQYMFQTVRDPETGDICVASPVGAYDYLLNIEHPLYLPCWVQKRFTEKLPKASRSVQALKTDSKAAQSEVGPRCN